MEIVQMRAEHVPAVAEMERECFCDPWSEKSIAAELENPLAYWLVAVEQGKACGYVGSQTVLGETDMMNLAVTADFRRKGIAQQLVLRLISDLAAMGSHSLCLEVRQSNMAARDLYEKLGFVQVGKRPGYYFNPREDAIILRKEWQL